MFKWALLFMLSLASAQADELSLHVFRSPLGINWNTPWKLATSILANEVAPVNGKRAFSISHVFVELNCKSTGQHIYRGMTSATTTEERDLLFKQKYGLGIMFHTYKGRYEKDQQILDDMEPYEGSRRHAILTYKIPSKTCQRLLDYANEYEELGYGNMYSGLQADPLKREGAGCSAFAVSFLRVGGLLSDYSSQWKQRLHVPARFVGGPLTGKKVNLLKILSRPAARWNSSEPNIYLEAWDPELIHKWVGRVYDDVAEGALSGEEIPEISKIGKTKQIIFDYTNRATPTGSFWLNK